MTTRLRIVAAGDAVLVAEFEARIDEAVNASVVALAEALTAARLPGVRDVVPTFRSVAVHFDPVRTDVAHVRHAIGQEAAASAGARPRSGRRVELPVCYDEPDFAPDLAEVARRVALAPHDVVARHTARDYRVFMLGFVPGFAYLGLLDEQLVVPRRDVPRPVVPAGSVAIAGQQTGVYPSPTPGGWHVIGRTPVPLLSSERSDPTLLHAGDTVRFVAIARREFDRLTTTGGRP